MAISLMIEKPDGTREFEFDSSFSEIIEVGEKIGLDMREFYRITDYSDHIEDELMIKVEDVKKLLSICQNMLNILLDLEKKGTIVLSSWEISNYEEMRRGSNLPPSYKPRSSGTISRLRSFIKLFQKAIAVNGSIIIIP